VAFGVVTSKLRDDAIPGAGLNGTDQYVEVVVTFEDSGMTAVQLRSGDTDDYPWDGPVVPALSAVVEFVLRTSAAAS
jgi:hypothetical protein